MSTVDYGIYKIGTRGIETVKSEGFFDFIKNIPTNVGMLKDIIIPTYGLWAGPGYAGGTRPTNNADIDWTQSPCMNESIKISGANPSQCYSLLDAITKTHDFRYTIAEEAAASGNVVAAKQLQIEADLEMYNNIKVALQTGVYECPTIYSTVGNYTLQGQTYTQIKEADETSYFDSTEKDYVKDLAALFAIKLEYLDDASDAQVAEANNYRKQIKQLIGTDLTLTDPNDPTKTINIKEQSNGIIYEISEGTTKFAWVIDDNADVTYEMGKVDGSVGTENTFVYEGNGKITINGGSGNDKITMGENENPTYYTLAGGNGYDTYYLTDGENYIITDSGENKILKEEEDGGYFGYGNFYKNSTDTVWHSADGSEEITGSGNDWTITFEDGSTVQFADTFQSGDFGINLITRPDNPVTTNTITGTENDDLFLNGTAANDLIEGGAGNDQFNVTMIGGAYGGNDWFKGGSGNDLIQAWFSENSLVEGNAGSDYITGSTGKNVLFGDDYGEMEQMIAAGEMAQSIDERGDLIRGDVSEDYIYGSSRNDILFGDNGKDLMVGGAGNDVIYGDADNDTVYVNVVQLKMQNQGKVVWQSLAQHDNLRRAA